MCITSVSSDLTELWLLRICETSCSNLQIYFVVHTILMCLCVFPLREGLKPPCRTLSSCHRNRRSTSPSCTRRTPTNVRSSPPSPMAWLHSAPLGQACRFRIGRTQPLNPPNTAARAAPPPTSQQTASQRSMPCPRNRP